MRSLVVYYSRTGNTRLVAEKIAQDLDADIEEIIDKKDRGGIIGFIKGGLDAGRKKDTEIEEPENDPADYDLVVVGTPVWAATVCPAIRTWLQRYGKTLKDVGFFLTTGGSGVEKTFNQMAQVGKTTPHETVAITVSEINKDAWKSPTDEFVDELVAAVKARKS